MFPSKGKSGSGRIDGVSAMMTAICEYLVANVEGEEIQSTIEVW
jgi:hypothetical protein